MAVSKRINTSLQPNKIEVQNLPIPKPTGRQLLVRVKAATLCHSDLGIASGAFGMGLFPVTLGHEAISVVQELGPDAAPYGLQVGDTIGAGIWQDMCLSCIDCTSSGPEFCTKMKMLGTHRAGYFAEYALIDADTAVVVRPAGDESTEPVSDLAPTFCAGITVWDALERAEPKMGETIAIVGLGGLGATAAQYAQALGVRVIALDVRDEQLLAAKKEGTADEIINTAGLSLPEVQRKVAEVNGGRLVNKAIVTSGAVPAYETGIGIVKAEGLIVAVGLTYEPVPVNIPMFVGRCAK